MNSSIKSIFLTLSMSMLSVGLHGMFRAAPALSRHAAPSMQHLYQMQHPAARLQAPPLAGPSLNTCVATAQAKAKKAELKARETIFVATTWGAIHKKLLGQRKDFEDNKTSLKDDENLIHVRKNADSSRRIARESVAQHNKTLRQLEQVQNARSEAPRCAALCAEIDLHMHEAQMAANQAKRTRAGIRTYERALTKAYQKHLWACDQVD